MERSILTAVLSGLVLAAPVAARAMEDPAAQAVARDRLPVLGTVGDLPPEKERVDIEVLPAPALLLRGEKIDLNGLREVLKARSQGHYDETGAKTSRLHVVIRADRDVRWQDVQWVMQTCADPAVRVYRILFAAVPEDGGAEGAMATYLPTDAGPTDEDEAPQPQVGLSIRLRPGENVAAAPGRTLYAHLEKTLARAKSQDWQATIDADPAVTTGAVLETVDALLRWGQRNITFRGAPLKTAEAPADRFQGTSDRPQVLVLDKEAAAPTEGDPLPPPVARVTGRLAGQVEPPHLVAVAANSVGFGGGTGGMFARRMGVKGDSEGTESAVTAGLDWLKNHQSPGGYWDCDGFEAMCRKGKCGGAGGPLFDPGVSGLALLAFLGHGETHKTPRYGHVLRNGLKYLKGIQDAEGCFGPRTSNHFVYNHALAALAMAEAFGLTQSPLFKSSAQNGVNFVLQCRNPYQAWRYGVRPQDNDTSITGWMVTALMAAERSGLAVDQEAYEGALAWLDKVTEPEYGRTGYTARGNGPARPQDRLEKFPVDRTEALTAVGVFVRILCGAGRDDPMVEKGADLCMKCLPVRDEARGSIDHYYWYYGTLAMFQVGGDRWRRWNEAMIEAVQSGRRRDDGDDRYGSWDPCDPWGGDGGRVYSTALNVLCLETCYRYARLPK